MGKASDRPKRTRRGVVAEETSEQTERNAVPSRNRNEQTSPAPPPKENRRNSFVPPSETRSEPTVAASTVKNDAASTRFEAELVFPSVFFRDGARRASKRKVRDVASLAVLLDAPKRFFADLCEFVRKFDRR